MLLQHEYPNEFVNAFHIQGGNNYNVKIFEKLKEYLHHTFVKAAMTFTLNRVRTV